MRVRVRVSEEVTVDTLPRQARHRAIPLGGAPAVRHGRRLPG